MQGEVFVKTRISPFKVNITVYSDREDIPKPNRVLRSRNFRNFELFSQLEFIGNARMEKDEKLEI